MNTDIDALQAKFYDIYGSAPEGLASAPGRVNIIGEFTDYNEGFVLPCALKFFTRAAHSKRDDERVVVHSLQYPGQRDEFSVAGDIAAGASPWGNYVRALVFALKARGAAPGGLNLLIDSDVPQGAGLSSSAALELAVGGAFNQAFALGFADTDLALIGQRAENDFLDCQCGIMDQLISAKGRAGCALLIDCRDLATRAVPMPAGLELLIINSNHPRKLVDSEYNQRRADCEGAAGALGKATLRDANLEQLEAGRAQMSANQYRRARHVITENTRVLDAVKAMAGNDVAGFSALMAASQRSLKEDFAVTVPATDWLVETCAGVLGREGAARMTGGGFGGAIVCLAPPQQVPAVIAAVNGGYTRATGLTADIFQCSAGDGLSHRRFET